MKRLTFIVGCLLIGSISYADCVYEGVSYPEGTKIGPYVCEDGSWILK